MFSESLKQFYLCIKTGQHFEVCTEDYEDRFRARALAKLSGASRLACLIHYGSAPSIDSVGKLLELPRDNSARYYFSEPAEATVSRLLNIEFHGPANDAIPLQLLDGTRISVRYRNVDYAPMEFPDVESGLQPETSHLLKTRLDELGLPSRLMNALSRNRICSLWSPLEQLVSFQPAALAELRNVGVGTMARAEEIVLEHLKPIGLSWATARAQLLAENASFGPASQGSLVETSVPEVVQTAEEAIRNAIARALPEMVGQPVVSVRANRRRWAKLLLIHYSLPRPTLQRTGDTLQLTRERIRQILLKIDRVVASEVEKTERLDAFLSLHYPGNDQEIGADDLLSRLGIEWKDLNPRVRAALARMILRGSGVRTFNGMFYSTGVAFVTSNTVNLVDLIPKLKEWIRTNLLGWEGGVPEPRLQEAELFGSIEGLLGIAEEATPQLYREICRRLNLHWSNSSSNPVLLAQGKSALKHALAATRDSSEPLSRHALLSVLRSKYPSLIDSVNPLSLFNRLPLEPDIFLAGKGVIACTKHYPQLGNLRDRYGPEVERLIRSEPTRQWHLEEITAELGIFAFDQYLLDYILRLRALQGAQLIQLGRQVWMVGEPSAGEVKRKEIQELALEILQAHGEPMSMESIKLAISFQRGTSRFFQLHLQPPFTRVTVKGEPMIALTSWDNNTP